MKKENTKHSCVFSVAELPDPYRPAHQTAAGGDVREAVRRDCEQQLRMVADMPSGSTVMSIRLIYKPRDAVTPPQARLSVFLSAGAADSGIAKSLPPLITQGPLARFYAFRPSELPEGPVRTAKAACHVSRRDRLVQPLITQEFNAKVPEKYYCCRRLVPNEENDFMLVDSVFDGIDEAVVVDITVEPADSARERATFSRYLARLQEINQIWQREDDLGQPVDLLGDGGLLRYGQDPVAPLHRTDLVAGNVLREMQELDEELNSPQLHYHIVILSQSLSTARLLGSIVAESVFEEGCYQLAVHEDTALLSHTKECLCALRVVDPNEYEILIHNPKTGGYPNLARLPHMASVEEMKGAWHLPVASVGSPRCIRKDTDPPVMDPASLIVVGHDCALHAGIVTSESRVPRGIHKPALVKHMFCTGMSGYGKTTAAFNLLLSLLEMGIPWLVLEPVKTEYRSLIRLARKGGSPIEIYTAGNEEVSPLRINPLEIPAGVSRDAHLAAVLNCFKAAMPIGGPLPAILAEALEEVYDEHPDPDYPPVLTELVRAAERVLAAKGYAAETNSDIRAAIEVRLGLLTRGGVGQMFQCRKSIPDVRHLLETPTIIEMACLAREQVCLLTLCILTAIDEAIRAQPFSGTLCYTMLLEEIHNILGTSRDASASEDNPDPKAFASEYICRILAEFRARGVALVILDQAPSAIAPEVVKYTASKLAFRQVAEDDRRELGAAMLFGQTEYEEIARLSPGGAYFFTDGYYGPRKIAAVNTHKNRNLSAATDAELREIVRRTGWFLDATRIRVGVEMEQLRTAMDDFDARRIHIVHDAIALLAALPRILARQRGEDRSLSLGRLAVRAERIRSALRRLHLDFVRGPYRRLLPAPEYVSPQQKLSRMREDLVQRFETICEPDTEKCLQLMESLIVRCRTPAAKEVQHAKGT